MATILIAMFSPATSDKIHFALSNREHACLEATDPQSLKKTLQSNSIDLILIAVNHHEKILKSFITAVKNTEEYQHIPIIAVINKSSIGEIDSMFHDGADECISKPFKLSSLLTKIDTILQEGVTKPADNINTVPEILETHIERIKAEGRQLGDIAEVSGGISVSDHKARRLSSPGSEWIPMIINEAVNPFYLGNEREYILLRKNLVRRVPPEEEYNIPEKILLRRSLTPLTAAVDTSRTIFSSELYGIQTAKGLTCSSLACILNSRYATFYFHRCRPPADGLRSIYLSKSDIQQLPLFIPTQKEQKQLDIFYKEISLVSSGITGNNPLMQRINILTAINSLIFKIMGIDEAGIKVFNSLHF